MACPYPAGNPGVRAAVATCIPSWPRIDPPAGLDRSAVVVADHDAAGRFGIANELDEAVRRELVELRDELQIS